MKLHIVGTDWELFSGAVNKITLPTELGMLTILPGHMNLASALTTWKLSYRPIDNTVWSSLDTFADIHQELSIVGWLAVVDQDIVTITME